ncbi:MAG: hypothetical protein ACR2KL_11035 [Nocardioidaceae bacterium]
MSAETVYVHVGLPKSGTTFIQSALWDSRSRLAAAGCLVPGDVRVASWRAASDLLGRRPQGAEAANVTGSWASFVEAIQRWDGDRAIFSEELLATASRRHANRIAASLRPSDVHVVLTVRDLARTIPSVWQQEVRKGRSWTWDEFVSAVRDPDSGPPTAGVAFWLRFDVERTLRIWDGVIPSANIHVVIVPPRGTAPAVLLDRFAEAVGIDNNLLTSDSTDANTALGVAETEVLRRLNLRLANALNERQYARAVVQSIIPALQARPSTGRSRLPTEHREWTMQKSNELITFLEHSPYRVIGDLADLAPETDPEGGRDPGDLDEAELVEPMTDALAAVCTAYGHSWWRSRRREPALSTDSTTRMSSRARAVGYRAKIAVLERADDNAIFGRVARSYLKLTASRR